MALCQVLVVGVGTGVEGLQAEPTFGAPTLATKTIFGSMYGRVEAFLPTILFDMASLALVLEPLILPIIQ
jgi:hypothetical protein